MYSREQKSSKKDELSSEVINHLELLIKVAENKKAEKSVAEHLAEIEKDVRHRNHELLSLLGEIEALNESSYFINDSLFLNRDKIFEFRKIIIEG